MPIGSAANLLLLLLYADEGKDIRGITKLEKLMYLLLKEGGYDKELKDDIHFEPFDFGPFSKEVYELVEVLKQRSIVNTRLEKYDTYREVIDELLYQGDFVEDQPIISDKKEIEIYSLARDKGFKLVDGLKARGRITDEDIKKVERLKSKYNRMKLNELLKYVYEKYPESTKHSKIVEKILGFGRRPDLKPFKREVNENGAGG